MIERKIAIASLRSKDPNPHYVIQIQKRSESPVRIDGCL